MCLFGATVIIATIFDVFFVAEKQETHISPTTDKSTENGFVVHAQMDDMKQGSAISANEEVRHRFVQCEDADNIELKKKDGKTYDLTTDQDEYTPSTLSRLLLSFSLNANIPRLMRAKHSPGSIKCLHGIRFLAMTAVIYGHSYSFVIFGLSPMVSNTRDVVRTFMTPFITQFFYQLWLVVDTFFLMSGFLVTYAFMKAIEKNGNRVSLKMMVLYYFHRYWRLTPVLLICVLFYAEVYPYIMVEFQGPFTYKELPDSAKCDGMLWRYVFYIQNLWPVDTYQDCFGHLWYLAIDMQLYIIAPVFIITTYFYPVIGSLLMVAGYAGSLTSSIVVQHQVYVEKRDDVDSFVSVYIKPWTRATTYFIGMGLGVFMYRTKAKVKLNKLSVAAGWFLAISLIFTAYYAGYTRNCDQQEHPNICGAWEPEGTVAYQALIPTMYGLGVAWIIFACVSGYGGFVDSFLSWNAWIPLSRLSYTTYLFHIIVLGSFYYAAPKQFYFTHYIVTYYFIGNMVVSLACAFVLSLVFEIPLLGVEKIIIPKK